MVEVTSKIYEILDDAKNGSVIPNDVTITTANDQSSVTLHQVDDLVNNIIFGIILVVTVLMFFLGFRNALFVGFAIPMSMFMSFMIVNLLGYTMNTMILFGLIMGLGMLVDNGIVVVENVYRLMEDEGMSRFEAAKKGIGEIAMPIIISTATTVAAFVPLGLWPGIMGEFMIYFPITLSVVLGSSLFVAVFINSVMVSQFMKTEDGLMPIKTLIIISLVSLVIGLPVAFFGRQLPRLGNFNDFYRNLAVGLSSFFKKLDHNFSRTIFTKIGEFLRTRFKMVTSWVYALYTSCWHSCFVGYFGNGIWCIYRK